MRGIAVRVAALDRDGLGDADLRGCLPVEEWDLDVSGSAAHLTPHRNDDMMALAHRGTEVGVVECGNEHEAVPRVDEPLPRTRSRDDQRAGTEVIDVVDIVAVTDETGADDGERFFPGGCRDGSGLRWLAKRVADLRDRRVATGEEEPPRKDETCPPGPPLPPGVGSRDVTGLAVELLGDPVVDAWRPLQPRLQIVGVVGADVGLRAVRAPGVTPVITVTPDAARDRDVRGGLGVDALGIEDPVVHVGLCLVPRLPARSQLPAGCAARDVGIVDITAHLPVPAGHRHAFACPHADLGDVRGGENQSADEHG